VYVSDHGLATGAGAILIYRADANGDAAPVRTIHPSGKRSAAPYGLAVGSDGAIFAATRRD
jgi:hypothetical protein